MTQEEERACAEPHHEKGRAGSKRVLGFAWRKRQGPPWAGRRKAPFARKHFGYFGILVFIQHLSGCSRKHHSFCVKVRKVNWGSERRSHLSKVTESFTEPGPGARSPASRARCLGGEGTGDPRPGAKGIWGGDHKRGGVGEGRLCAGAGSLP